MSNYTKITDFALKDNLLTGNPLKLITGTAHDNEYNAIAVAVATKVDSGGALGTPSSGTLTNCTGLPVSSGVSGLGTGVATALGVNVGSAGAAVVNGGVLGTPSSGTLTNCSGLPLSGVTDSTSEALGVGTLEVGHASDTTISRVSAGTIAVEGVNVLTTATGAALAGSATQQFSAAAATSAAHVVRADQVLGVLAAQSLIRLNTANGYGSTNTTIRRFTTTVTSQGTDITYADSATNGASFTINVNGVYGIEYTDNFTAAGSAGISLNSSQLSTGIASITIADILSIGTGPAANQLCVSSWSGYLPAGSVIRAHTGGAAAGTSPVLFTIGRIG